MKPQLHEQKFHITSNAVADTIKLIFSQYLFALSKGNAEKALSYFEALLSNVDTHFYRNQFGGYKAFLHTLNSMVLSRFLATNLPALSCFQVFTDMDIIIEHSTSIENVQVIIEELTKRYCALINKNEERCYSTTVTAAIFYIEDHLDQKLSLKELAKVLDKNPSYLSKQFKLETGITLTSYIQEKKIDLAKQYLSSGNISISEIAISLGYDDFGYFSKIFKKYTSHSPLEYKKTRIL